MNRDTSELYDHEQFEAYQEETGVTELLADADEAEHLAEALGVKTIPDDHPDRSRMLDDAEERYERVVRALKGKHGKIDEGMYVDLDRMREDAKRRLETALGCAIDVLDDEEIA